MDELWVCLDCDYTGHLTTSGACERCSSQAVATAHNYPDKIKGITLKNVTFVCSAMAEQQPNGTVKHWFEHRICIGEEDGKKWPMP